MIISTKKEAYIKQFESLLNDSKDALNTESTKKTEYYLTRTGKKLEDDVYNKMRECSKGSVFEGTIDLVSGQKFPDIVALGYYGVEVKSTTQNHWTTTGNSVLESTRVDGIERIYMLFGKLSSPVEFRYRRYEDCLSEVVVTHSPRYLIDMTIDEGDTIFDKIDIDYNSLRSLDNPIKAITDYYRSKLKEGEEIWWLDTGSDTKHSSIITRFWSSLSESQKYEYMVNAFVLFPEIFGSSSTKYNKYSFWLLNQGVISTSLRDIFTAGGQFDIKISGRDFSRVPRIFNHINKHMEYIHQFINNQDIIILIDNWGIRNVNATNKLIRWIEIVSRYSIQNGYNPTLLLETLFGV